MRRERHGLKGGRFRAGRGTDAATGKPEPSKSRAPVNLDLTHDRNPHPPGGVTSIHGQSEVGDTQLEARPFSGAYRGDRTP